MATGHPQRRSVLPQEESCLGKYAFFLRKLPEDTAGHAVKRSHFLSAEKKMAPVNRALSMKRCTQRTVHSTKSIAMIKIVSDCHWHKITTATATTVSATTRATTTKSTTIDDNTPGTGQRCVFSQVSHCFVLAVQKI